MEIYDIFFVHFENLSSAPVFRGMQCKDLMTLTLTFSPRLI